MKHSEAAARCQPCGTAQLGWQPDDNAQLVQQLAAHAPFVQQLAARAELTQQFAAHVQIADCEELDPPTAEEAARQLPEVVQAVGQRLGHAGGWRQAAGQPPGRDFARCRGFLKLLMVFQIQ
jgi:hypothetical protein